MTGEQAEAAFSLRMEQEIEKRHVPRPWENVTDRVTERRLAMLNWGSTGQGCLWKPRGLLHKDL